MKMKIVLIRHGESELNRINKKIPTYCGRYNTSLTKQGREQARMLQKNAYVEKIEKVYASDLERAIETAILAKPDKPIEIRKEITERSLGIFEGKKETEIRLKYPQYFSDKKLMRFRFDKEIKAPGGENYQEVIDRARKFLESLDLTEDTTIGIFSHMSCIRCLLYLLLGLEEEKMYSLIIKNTVPIVLKGDILGKFELVSPQKEE